MPTVYVLGAGSSKAVTDKAPLNNDLLVSALNMKGDERVAKIKKFLDTFYWRIKDPPPLEDVLTQVDSCITESRSISSAYDLPNLIKLREDLVYAICEVLANALKSMPTPCLMDEFVKHLQPETDTIISLNYDLIMDNTLIRANMPFKHGFDVRSYVHQQKEGRCTDVSKSFTSNFKDPDRTPIDLIKLHGSLSWLYCPACRAIDVTYEPNGGEVFYGAREIRLAHCPICQSNYESYIVTPTFLKNYGVLYLSQIWHHAEEKLANADHIVFIGYSMPEADTILRTMFSRAVFRHREINSPTSKARSRRLSVTVVGKPKVEKPKPEEKDAAQQLEQRYKSLFGGVTFYHKGFENYVSEMPALETTT